MIIWYSGGIASAVAAWFAVRSFREEKRIVRIWIADEVVSDDLDDALRRVTGEDIIVIASAIYKSVDDVARKKRFVRSNYGAPCTSHLKRDVRLYVEKFIENEIPIRRQVFGFTEEERRRAERLQALMPEYELVFPLIEKNLTKADCLELARRHLAVPVLYQLGFRNNNCIGCVKSSSVSYWRRVRKYFPEMFQKRMELQKDLGFWFIPDLDVDADKEREEREKGGEGCSLFCAIAEQELSETD